MCLALSIVSHGGEASKPQTCIAKLWFVHLISANSWEQRCQPNCVGCLPPPSTHSISILVELGKIDDAGICTLSIFWQLVDAVVAWTWRHTQVAQSWRCERRNTRLTAVTRQSTLLAWHQPVTTISRCSSNAVTQAGLQQQFSNASQSLCTKYLVQQTTKIQKINKYSTDAVINIKK